MYRSHVHFISVASATISPHPHAHARARVCEYTHSDTPHQTTHLHPPPSGEQEVWERESDWLSGLTLGSQLPVN